MYEWSRKYSNDVVNDTFLKGVLNLLVEGVTYTNENGKIVGHVNSIEGPLGLVKIISDTSLSTQSGSMTCINIIYLNKFVFNCFYEEKLKVGTFINGHWANSVCKYGRHAK